MYPLVETIKLKDGLLLNLEYHNRRFHDALRNYFGIKQIAGIHELIAVPDDKHTGLYRCRVVYSPAIEKIEFLPYFVRPVRTLKLVEDNEIDYRYKFAERERLNHLFSLREDCDDILIVKNGLLTDSFAANSVFFDGENWYTPDNPLLKGTTRTRLLEEGKIRAKRITPSDLGSFQSAVLINALLDFGEMPAVPIQNISW